MRTTIFFLAALSLAASAGSWAQATDLPAWGTPPALSGMRVHLFENDTGKLSEEDVAAPSHRGLWNSIAGPHKSNAGLVLVEISGPPIAVYTGYLGPQTKYSVRLVATESGRKKRLLDQSQVIPVLNESGKTYLAFLIHQDGCRLVNLTATLVGSQPGKPLQRSVGFACGE